MTSGRRGRYLLTGLATLLLAVPAAANPLTRSDSIADWKIECTSPAFHTDEECLVRTGPHVARVAGKVSGYSLLIDPERKAVSIESQDAVALEARVDDGQVFSTDCRGSGCAFPDATAAVLLQQMDRGRVLFTRLTTPQGQLTGRHSLSDFQSALAIAKEPAAGFPDRRLSGSEIRLLQSLLSKQGFDPGPEDGLMGPRTRDAIVSYQRANSVTPNGIPTKSLLARLQSSE